MRNHIRCIRVSKRLIVILFFVISITSCNNRKIQEPNYCIGSFSDYAYDIDSRKNIFSDVLGGYVNDHWNLASKLPTNIQGNGYGEMISGQTNSENGKELWINTGFHYFHNNQVYENSIDIYNVDKNTWRKIPVEVHGYDYIVDRLLIINDDTIFASNTGNIDDETIGEIPVLSKYNAESNEFFPVDSTKYVFNGTRSEIIKNIVSSHIIFDGVDSIWIFSYDGLIIKYNIYDDSVTQTNILQNSKLYDVSYIEQGHLFYILKQNSRERNIIGVTDDYDIIKMPLQIDQIEVITSHPFYWPSSTTLWVDDNGSLWFDTIGYMDTDQNWHLIMPNIGEYIYEIYHSNNELYVAPNIIEETSDGKLWFIGNYGVAWLNKENSTGCWDSTYASDIFEDDSGTLWMINQESLYYLK